MLFFNEHLQETHSRDQVPKGKMNWICYPVAASMRKVNLRSIRRQQRVAIIISSTQRFPWVTPSSRAPSTSSSKPAPPSRLALDVRKHYPDSLPRPFKRHQPLRP